jgi:hypothetical protein
MRSFSAVAPERVEVLWHDEALSRLDSHPSLPNILGHGFFLGRVGEIGWAGLSVRQIPLFDEECELHLDDDLGEFVRGIEALLDQASDAFTEISTDPWPNRTFPEPHARVDSGVLRMWFGSDQSPAVELPPISLVNCLLPDSSSER